MAGHARSDGIIPPYDEDTSIPPRLCAAGIPRARVDLTRRLLINADLRPVPDRAGRGTWYGSGACPGDAPAVRDARAHSDTVLTATPAPLVFEGGRAFQHVEEQVALGPRITGSQGSLKLGDQVLAHLAAQWLANLDPGVYLSRRSGLATWSASRAAGPNVVILGAHYDTRRLADQDPQRPDQPVPGANDGASGVAVLMELARALEFDKVGSQVWLVFFDAEDNGELDGWDWIVGSRHFASTLSVTPTAVVIVDMVGDQQQELYLERNSDPELMQEIWDVARRLGYGDQFHSDYKWSMIDDHTPFRERGLRAIDIIDFDYPYWHTLQDTPDKISPLSLERVGKTLEVWLEGE